MLRGSLGSLNKPKSSKKLRMEELGACIIRGLRGSVFRKA